MTSSPGIPIVRSTHLPLPPASLIGRAQELEIARQQLLSKEVRLLTLTGPGGVGKTRLALAVAGELAEVFDHGAWFVDLAPVRDPELVLPAIAQVLGIHEAGDRPLAETLTAYLQDRYLMLILDNFEQVLAAAPPLAGLLQTCPGLNILVTSRERLRLRWEWTLTVPPLALPDLGRALEPDTLAQVPAVALFVQRAQAAKTGFQLTPTNAAAVATLCTRLDGLPLAIELAAARVGILTPAEILARLERGLPLPGRSGPDTPGRHQTLQAAIHWSYDLLPAGEQGLFRRLGVFAGGWSLAAAEAVVSSTEPGEDVLTGLTSLVEKSLVQVLPQAVEGETRFGLLESIREVALVQLEASGEAETIRRRHAAYYTTLAERTPLEAKGKGQQAWFDILEREHDNLRAALRWSSEGGDSLPGLRTAAAVWFFWWLRGHISEGRQWLERTLARNPEAPDALRLVALEGLGTLVGWQGEYEQGVSHLDEAAALARGLGDESGLTRILGRIGWIAWLNGRAERVEELALALDECQKGADAWSLAYSYLSLGGLLYEIGREPAAIQALEEALVFFQNVEENHGVAFALGKLALLRNRQGDPALARRLAREGLEFALALHDPHIIAYCADDIALLIGKQAPPEPLVRLLGGIDRLRQRIGLLRTPGERAAHRELVDMLRNHLGPANYNAAWAEGRELPADQVAELGLGLLAEPPASQPLPASTPGASAVPNPLSEREREVFRLVAEGLSNQQIADQLFITERTVRFHVTSVFNKLGADNRAQAIALATQRGLL